MSMHINFENCMHNIQGSNPKEYFVDWAHGTSGKIIKGCEKELNDFAIRITALVEAGEMTGYYCVVKREMDGEER